MENSVDYSAPVGYGRLYLDCTAAPGNSLPDLANKALDLGFCGVRCSPMQVSDLPTACKSKPFKLQICTSFTNDTLEATAYACKKARLLGADELVTEAPSYCILTGKWGTVHKQLKKTVRAAKGTPVWLRADAALLSEADLLTLAKACNRQNVAALCLKTSVPTEDTTLQRLLRALGSRTRLFYEAESPSDTVFDRILRGYDGCVCSCLPSENISP